MIDRSRKYPIFNDKYEMFKELGEGNTSKVYLAQALNDQVKPRLVAIKVLKPNFLHANADNIRSVENEIRILKHVLSHKNIVALYEYGDDGVIVKPSGRHITKIIYTVMEYVPGDLLFDACQSLGAMGEDAGRFFASQMLDTLEYIHSK